jgi:peptidoglycan/xylan/chitin deacetylase (PgdA/CDA1 family)
MSRILNALKHVNTRLQLWGATKSVILIYHRISASDFDPWRLSVSPQHFTEHLDIIRQQTRPMDLQQLAAAQREGNVPHRAVVITFDDGYANNLHSAKPLLERYNIPATVFVTSGMLDADREPWWDELERVLLQPGRLPETLKLTINGQTQAWHLGTATQYNQEDYQRDRHRKAWEGQPNSRLAFYHSVWNALRILPNHQRETLQNDILNWASATPQARDIYRSLTTKELLELEQGGLIEIGAHTVTHPSLPSHSIDVQRDEIHRSKQELEQILNHPIQSFAYPFGDFNRNSVQATQDSGFEQACSTIQQPVWKGSNCFQLPRFEVQNWERDVFEEKLSKWLA